MFLGLDNVLVKKIINILLASCFYMPFGVCIYQLLEQYHCMRLFKKWDL